MVDRTHKDNLFRDPMRIAMALSYLIGLIAISLILSERTSIKIYYPMRSMLMIIGLAIDYFRLILRIFYLL